MVVNPYRDQESGVIADVGFKIKAKKPSPVCGYRAVVLFVLMCIICGSYYLHLKFHSTTLRDNPSVRGSINTYKSFSQSIRDFPAQMQQDLVKLDDLKHPPNPPIDLKKPANPAEVQRPGKINTFRTESEKQKAASVKIPINPLAAVAAATSAPLKAKPLEPISPEIADRLQMESRNANAVEDKVVALADAENLRKERERLEILDKQRQQEEQKQREEQERLQAAQKQRDEKERKQAEQKQREEEERVKADQRWREEQLAVAAKREEERLAKARLAEQQAAAIAAAVPEKLATPAEAEPQAAPEVVPPVPPKSVDAVEHSAEKSEIPADLPQVHDHPSVGGEEQTTEKDALHPAHVLPLEVPPPNAAAAEGAVVAGAHTAEEPHAQAAQDLEHNSPPVVATLKKADPVDADAHADAVAGGVEDVPPVAVVDNAETVKRPTGYDLPPAIKPKVAATNVAAEPAEKVDYCAGHVDPFQSTPVDTFEPPVGASFEEALQWRNAVKAMVSKISKVKYGGEELRTLMKGEVEALRVMRFKMFCKYA